LEISERILEVLSGFDQFLEHFRRIFIFILNF